MDRRDLFRALGAVGAGAVMGGTAAGDHTKKGDANPAANLHAHFCGIHVAKKDPKFQLITQHYCAGHGDDMFQCILFDSTEKNAKLLGVEYIVTDEVYRKLPDAEKPYWHPHTYEVLGGGLIAPSMAPADEQKFMKMILTTWGKAWHTWPDPKTAVPMGDPLLIWSLTGDGQADEKVVATRDREFGVATNMVREKRIKEYGYDVPSVPQPKSMDTIGRQWTGEGEDKPTKKE